MTKKFIVLMCLTLDVIYNNNKHIATLHWVCVASA